MRTEVLVVLVVVGGVQLVMVVHRPITLVTCRAAGSRRLLPRVLPLVVATDPACLVLPHLVELPLLLLYLLLLLLDGGGGVGGGLATAALLAAPILVAAGILAATLTLVAPLALPVLLLDVSKGAVPVAVAGLLWPEAAPGWPALVACTAFVGHCWPVYLEFRGGKGVATGAGALLALTPLPTLVAAAV